MIKILFICHGNICRSPMAEFILKKLVKEQGRENDFEIQSAATSTDAVGEDIYSYAKDRLIKHDVPFTIRSARQITKSDLSYFDYIVAMDSLNISDLHNYPGNSEKYSLLLDYTNDPRDISDPWYTRDFEKAYQDIENGCKGLLSKLI